ncbi:hypothetical protein QSJ19_01150 [Gordonia sp. ABSL11-1]|uniref:hypothetical protein n=1 Tax=Gordonia sp. ABSL11-1 TaxID=3053924 RepID=UPI002573ED44|nr:hypothetical protein [Gordonia sp. ABSL11-1]MDL9944209.1 hypothetical protein [Gordonia sp. ABSL11-1]
MSPTAEIPKVSKLNRKNLGYEHNQLAEVARRLERDGNAAALDYRVRADEAQKVYEHISNLGYLVDQLRTRGMRTDVGADLIDWLLAHDWTPPTYLPTTEEEI